LNVELGTPEVSMEDVKAKLLRHFLVLFEAHV
jgi:lipoyl(octanoyl) transferase